MEVIVGRRHHNPDKPIRHCLDCWYLAFVLPIVYLVDSPGVVPNPNPHPPFTIAALAAYLLGGFGQIVCALALIFAQNRWRPDSEDDHRLRLLLLQASAVLGGATVATHFWAAQVAGVPVGAAVGLTTLPWAAESLLVPGMWS